MNDKIVFINEGGFSEPAEIELGFNADGHAYVRWPCGEKASIWKKDENLIWKYVNKK